MVTAERVFTLYICFQFRADAVSECERRVYAKYEHRELDITPEPEGTTMSECWLECNSCGTKVPLDELKGACNCGGALLVRYDMDELKREITKEKISGRKPDMWRYAELLPVRKASSRITLGEGYTPLIKFQPEKLLFKDLWVKREDLNPTGSFKARGLALAVSLLHERGYRKVAVPSNGNAASALAAYAARAQMESYVFVPKDCPTYIIEECLHYGANTSLVDGYIHHAAKIVEDGKKDQSWFHVGTLKEPGRVEGKKTMGLEVAEQFDWQLPDVIVYPTGGGSGVIGMWKAFHELVQLGFVKDGLPRFISVQEKGCQPLVDGLKPEHERSAEAFQEVTSSPTGMRVPKPPNLPILLNIIRETGGTAVAVSGSEIAAAQRMFGTGGITSSPEGAATLAGLLRLQEEGLVQSHERIVLFNTSHAMKYRSYPLDLPIPAVKNYAEWLAATNR